MNQGVKPLKDVLKDDFLIGAAVASHQLTGRHAEILKKHFNCIVAENLMKPEEIQPEEGVFQWEQADRIVAFAKANGMHIRFHTLVWHNQTPDWFFQDGQGREMAANEENKRLLLKRLENHITVVVGRYKEDIDSWDVVNEVIEEQERDGLRRSKWQEITGTAYIEEAFRITREVAGDKARLYINDYNTNKPDKREALFKLVEELLEKGVPIDGVGHQMHINIGWPTAENIGETIDLFSSLGLDNQITEMEVSLYENDRDKLEQIPEELLIRQGHKYKEVFEVFRDKSAQISAVVTWGIGDDHTWLKTFPITRKNLPLIFDEHLQPKHAYWGIADPERLPENPVEHKAGKISSKGE